MLGHAQAKAAHAWLGLCEFEVIAFDMCGDLDRQAKALTLPMEAAWEGTYSCSSTQEYNPSSSSISVSQFSAPTAAVSANTLVRELLPGSSFMLTCDAYAADTTPTVSWYKDGKQLGGATGETLEVTDAQLSDAGMYQCQAESNSGATMSDMLEVVVLGPPVVGAMPAFRHVSVGSSVEIVCPATTAHWKLMARQTTCFRACGLRAAVCSHRAACGHLVHRRQTHPSAHEHKNSHVANSGRSGQSHVRRPRRLRQQRCEMCALL